ncbi:MAG: peptidoglycan editing factor PgeF [Flammeovirgaceae bacterium]
MKYHTHANIPYYQFDHFSTKSSIRHYIATRHGGVSTGEFSSLNISLGTADDRENILENRQRIAQLMQIEPQQLVFPSQTHDATIQVVTQTKINQGTIWLNEQLRCTDALITNEKGICLSVISADCVPLLFFDPVQQAIGAVHAGWRGTVKKIAQKAVQKMQETFSSKPEDLLIGIGPSIGPERYEVGPEVIEAVITAFGTKKGLVSQETKEGKGLLNLWEANKLQLLNAGVASKHIELAGLCTLTHSDIFFSARSMRGKGGRFASGIILETKH